MPHIFISYAKKDTRALAEALVAALNAVPGVTAWMDMSLEADSSWAGQIQHEIDRCDYLIVLLSPDVNRAAVGGQRRSFVLNEIDYAQAENKPILPVMVQAAKVPVQIAGIQYIDLTKRPADPEPIVQRVKQRFDLESRPVSSPAQPSSAAGRRLPVTAMAAGLGALALVIAIVFIAINAVGPGDLGLTPTPRDETTAAAAAPSPTLTEAASPTLTPSITPTATDDLAATQAAEFQASLTALGVMQAQGVQTATADAATRAAASQLDATLRAAADTATAGAIAITQAVLGETATQQSAEATRTRDVEMAIQNLTATADAWTNTPTPTFTPSSIPPTPTPTSDSLEAALDAARSFSGSNADWEALYPEGFVHTFEDGVPMVLVPAGCFMMGSSDGNPDEQPVHEQCFDAPFWIDLTEVTQADFERLGGIKANPNRFDGDERPVENITWFEARDFCDLRDARLLTEREWEYAARGPESLVYPWGNALNADNVVGFGNSSDQTANVGSRPAGASWVGALDMSGNVWEWVSSLYQDYPYSQDHESSSDTNSSRVVRGGSWYGSDTFLRGAARNWNGAGGGYRYVGFRCARSS